MVCTADSANCGFSHPIWAETIIEDTTCLLVAVTFQTAVHKKKIKQQTLGKRRRKLQTGRGQTQLSTYHDDHKKTYKKKKK